MFQFTWLLVPLIAPVLLLPPLLWVLVENRDHPRISALTVIVLATSATLWSLADALRVALVDPSLKVLAYNGYFVFGTLVVVTLYLFAVDYTDESEWLSLRRGGLLFGAFGATTVLELTNVRNLAYRSMGTVELNGAVFLDPDWTLAFYAHHLLAYLLVGAAAYMFLTYETSHRQYRGQVVSILAAVAVVWGLNIAYLTGVTQVNYTSAGFAFAIPLAAMMIFRYDILDAVPIARSVVIDEMETGFLVLDHSGAVVDVNDRASTVLRADPETLLGLHRVELLDRYPKLAPAFEDEEATFAVQEDGETRQYQVTATDVTGADDRDRGTVVLFQNVTELVETRSKLRERTQVLERQNQRLEEFAGMVSHDLRNPLAIAQGQLELARMEYDDERLEKADDALGRIDELVDDVLTLARQGRTVTDPESASLPDIAYDAWENVETQAATLKLDTSIVVTADPSRLVQLFENLFRNAVEHGGPEVTVRIGDLDEGFFVEDDGPGIPDDERDKVFEKGFTTADDGTGFGLAIVRQTAHAHDWDAAVAEGSDGGARFEFTGVTTRRPPTTEDSPTRA